jgi:hypothetical protein
MDSRLEASRSPTPFDILGNFESLAKQKGSEGASSKPCH